MLHLVYRFKLTPRARADLAAFWQWVRERQTWFYTGLDTVRQTRWYVVTIGPDVHAIEHWVSFADEAAWGTYRRQVAEQSRQPAWERRRASQDEWWEMLDARLLSDAPGPIDNIGR